MHSVCVPAVGYRIGSDRRSLFYVPDVVDIVDRKEALAGLDLFVGDGATLTRPLVRRRSGALFGHTTVRAQLGWCAAAGVERAVFTHCGTDLVTMDGRSAAAQVRALGRERGVAAQIARDGMEIELG